jgi:hypothetical protein
MASGFQRLAVALAAVAATVGCGGAPGPTQEATIIPAVSAIDVDQTADLAVSVTGFRNGDLIQFSWCVERKYPEVTCCWCPTDANSPCDWYLTLEACTDGYLKGPLKGLTATFVPRRVGTFRARVDASIWGTSEKATATAVITVSNPAP